MTPPPHLAASLAALLLLPPPLSVPAAAQQGLTLRLEVAASPLERADALYAEGAPASALRLLEERIERGPDDHAARWRAARAALSLGLLEASEEAQNRWYERAILHGERARALAPDDLDGLYWLLAAKGRLAIQSPPRTTARLAREVYELAHGVLAVDSLHAGAWNALGKLNYEVMRLSSFERFLARVFLGNEALRRTSWEDAERFHLRAVELDGANPLFRLDLGTTYLFTERYAEAATELQLALDLPPRHPGDALYKEEARRYLGFAREGRRP